MEAVDRMMRQSSFNYIRSKDDVWKSIEEEINSRPDSDSKMVSLNPIRTYWAVAASLALLLVSGITAFLYTVVIEVPRGQTATIELPDGSDVNLNSQSTLSFKPLWWYISREANLSGEAFFDVEKGSVFSIHSVQGTVQVLGTSFNIYSRNNTYNVYCATGKVLVKNNTTETVIVPGELVVLEGKELVKSSVNKQETILAWKSGKFIYNATSLKKVLMDMEMQYDVRITTTLPNLDSYHYTGIFERSVDAKSALEIICDSFGFSLHSTSDGVFIVEDSSN